MDHFLTLLDALLADPAALLALAGAAGLACAGLAAGGMWRNRAALRRRTTEGFERTGQGSSGSAGRAQPLERLVGYLETTFAQSDEKQTRVLRLRLVQAGFYDQRAPGYYFAARIAAGLAMGLLGLLAAPFAIGNTSGGTLWLCAGVAGTVGYLAPNFYLSSRIKRRAQAHRIGFPDFMDLMVVCSEAGLSMEAGIERIARELVEGHPSLAENLYMVSLELRAGKSLGEALERFGRRLGIEEASMLANLLQQSADLGTSLTQSLKVYSEEMRNKRLSRAEEKAYALPAKLVVPLTLFVFPILIVALMLPVVIRVRDSFM